MRISVFGAWLALIAPGVAGAQDGIAVQKIDGAPFAVITSPDSRHLYLTQSQISGYGHSGVASFTVDAPFAQDGFVPLDAGPAGAALSPDGKWLAVAAQSVLYLIDTTRVAEGKAAIVWKMSTPSSIDAAFSPDGKFLFVPQEQDQRITVIDLEKAAAAGPSKAVVGSIPTGDGPVSVAASADGRYLYATSQMAPDRMKWPTTCGAESQGGRHTAKGAVLTIDLVKAQTDPGHSVVSVTPAGCKPVRLALSADSATLYVTSRQDNAVLIMDTAKMAETPDVAVTGQVAVDGSPVGIAVDSTHNRLFVARSDRFSDPPKPSSVAVIDLSAPVHLSGKIPAGLFPREVSVTPDGHWLFVSNYWSGILERVDLSTAK